MTQIQLETEAPPRPKVSVVIGGGGIKTIAAIALFEFLDEAERCDRVGYVYHSKLITYGLPDELKSLPEVSPAGMTWAEVICAQPTAAFVALKRASYLREVTIIGQSVRCLLDAREGAERLRETLASAGIAGAEVVLTRPSLEDVFVALTKLFTARAAGSLPT
jgi:ABC-type multidrug transport system ATPase subunit